MQLTNLLDEYSYADYTECQEREWIVMGVTVRSAVGSCRNVPNLSELQGVLGMYRDGSDHLQA